MLLNKVCFYVFLLNNVETENKKCMIKLYIIIIIKKGQQCKAEREWYTPYQSKDPAPQYQPIDRNKKMGKRVEDYSRNRAA